MAGEWLTIGEVIARYRSEGWADSESTIRREVDDRIKAGKLETYRTRGGHRRVKTTGIDALIAERRQEAPPPEPAE